MNETFDISELEGIYTERSMVVEATQRDTVRKGDYVGDIKQVTPRLASEESPFPGRECWSLQISVRRSDGRTVTLFKDVSHQLYRKTSIAGERVLLRPKDEGYDTSLPMDKPSKLWAQLEGVFNTDGTLTIPEVVKAIAGSQVGVYIMEGFINSDGDIIWPNSRPTDFTSSDAFIAAYDEEKKEAASKGFLPKNYISNFHKVRV